MVDTTSFFAPPSCFSDRWVTLPEDEAHHVSNVLRGGRGEDIVVVDGEGGWYRVHLQEVGHEKVSGRVVEERREVGEPPYDLTIGMSLLKQRRRFETFLEKAVELGVRRIIPLNTRRTEKDRLRTDRARRVMIAAMKQTLRSRLPVLDDIHQLEDVLGRTGDGLSLICHERTGAERDLARTVQEGAVDEISVLVGPEGGFTADEVTRAKRSGWNPVSLGPRRLRAETAGIVTAAVVESTVTLQQSLK